MYTIQPCTSLQCHFVHSHIRRVHARLAVTCHLHYWHNDRDLLRATAVTQGCNGYRNKSQHTQKGNPGEENSTDRQTNSNRATSSTAGNSTFKFFPLRGSFRLNRCQSFRNGTYVAVYTWNGGLLNCALASRTPPRYHFHGCLGVKYPKSISLCGITHLAPARWLQPTTGEPTTPD